MDRESEYLLHLLGAYLREERPEPIADADWKKLTQLARTHNVVGILGYMAMSWKLCPDPQLQSGLRMACLNTIGSFAGRGALAEEFSSRLSERGIDHIVMKGLVLRHDFPVPELRTFGDVDLVIRPEDREKCHGLMLELGFSVKTDWEPVYTYVRGTEVYEIHTRIMEVDVAEKANCRPYFDRAWDHARRTGEHRFEFTPEFHFLYLLTHIAKHVAGRGAGIRMYLDVAAFLRRRGGELDWNRVEQDLERLSLSDFANTALTLVYDCFGIAAPGVRKPLPEQLRRDFLEFTMSGGIFGREGQTDGVHALEQGNRGGDEISKAGTLMKRLFPPAESIRDRYTYLQEKPWLLPAAWVHRLAVKKTGWREHTRQAREILSADKETVRKLAWFYRDIGL